MVRERLFECTVLVPTRKSTTISGGDLHPAPLWEQLEQMLLATFDRLWMPQGLFRTLSFDAESGRKREEDARGFIVAVSEGRLDELRRVLADACDWFGQQSIRLSIAGRVEFVSKR